MSIPLYMQLYMNKISETFFQGQNLEELKAIWKKSGGRKILTPLDPPRSSNIAHATQAAHSMTCLHLLQSGRRQGQSCGNRGVQDQRCAVHVTKSTDTDNQVQIYS